MPRLRSKSMTAVPTASSIEGDTATEGEHDRPARRASMRVSSRLVRLGGDDAEEVSELETLGRNDAAAVLRTRGRPSKLSTSEEVLIFDLPGREHAEWLVKCAQEELEMPYMRWKRSPVRSTLWITSLFRCKDYNVRRLGSSSKDRCQSQIYFTYDAANNKVYGKWRWHHPSHSKKDHTRDDVSKVIEIVKKIPSEHLPPLSPTTRIASVSESRSSMPAESPRESNGHGTTPSSASPIKRKYEHLGEGAQTRSKRRSLIVTNSDSRSYPSPSTAGSGRSTPEGQLVRLSEQDKIKNFRDGVTLTLQHLVAFAERADPEQWLRIGSEELERDYLILRKMGSRIFNRAFNLES